jgi:hypothetical protein
MFVCYEPARTSSDTAPSEESQYGIARDVPRSRRGSFRIDALFRALR